MYILPVIAYNGSIFPCQLSELRIKRFERIDSVWLAPGSLVLILMCVQTCKKLVAWLAPFDTPLRGYSGCHERIAIVYD
jgi:hypothetical protein